ncbi:MAG: 4Fe-4S cluster-binding domain-containing protein [Candidatus Hydrogenedentes bacterium]|nr:4Fe-4S cluster-binding domain-containing protein [Candidatus Hydrogenedentota bacterium]
MSLSGKRLLHLGGALFQTPALACAKRLGCHVILLDYNSDVPGRAYADTFESVSTTDFEGALTVARKHRIDGVMTYASDSSVATVAHVARELHLPGNPPEATDIIRRKDLFRVFQQERGLPHPKFFATGSLEEALARIDELTFPVVVKPVDSAGTKGQSVIYGKREVGYALETALARSRMKRAVFEDFVHTDMMELDGDVWFERGRLAFRHYGHNHFLKNRISNVPSGEIFPGFFDESLARHLDGQFNVVIEGLGLRAGCMNFDALANEDKVYILDIGLRNGGNFVPDVIKLSTGFDLTEAAVYSALGVDYPCESLYCANPKPVASYLMGSRFSGRFEGYEFSPELKPYVVETRLFAKPGSDIQPFTRADMAAGIAFMEFPDMDVLRESMEHIEDLVKLRVVPVRDAYRHTNGSTGPRPKRGTVVDGEFKEFPELISPFLRQKLIDAEANNNQDILRVLGRQYVETAEESHIRVEEGLKHYEASEQIIWEGERLHGVERLYRRLILFEPLYQCVAHCRYCLRRNYEPFHQTREDIRRIARYVGQAEGHDELREVLVTGGDPFLAPHKVEEFLDAISECAPQIQIVRVATRVPIHQPDRVNDRLLATLGKPYPFRVEVATQINHALELFPEVEEAYRRVLDTVRVVYNQTVLLRGVNDTLDELVELCDRLRLIGIENHYLFHCVPIGGLNSLRTPLMRGIELARALSSCGRISGRAKPQFAVMTAIGKITLYEGAIVDHKDNKYLLRSDYDYEERLAWNPTWRLPANAVVGADGKLCVWYEDAAEEVVRAPHSPALAVRG